MKKQLIFALSASLLLCSCGAAGVATEAASKKCENAVTEYSKTITTWTTDITNKTKCNAVKTSLEAAVNACDAATFWSAADKAKFKKELADWKCD